MKLYELHWAAGFLEGEGSFTAHARGIKVSAGQVQKQPLDRLVSMFGGGIYPYQPKMARAKPLWHWHLNGRVAAGLMMTLWPLMSPRRREQIERALATWKAVPKWQPKRGEDNPSAKLTLEQVVAIRAAPIGGQALADRFGVSRATISHIRAGRIWRNAEGFAGT